MTSQPITVLKFGSSVLARKRDLGAVVHEIYRELRAGRRVVAVVSAIGSTTDALAESAARIRRGPDGAGEVDGSDGADALALLLSTGESTAAALLALALERAGISAEALDPARIGLVASGTALDADPIDVDAGAIRRVLAERSVAVVPGFFGRDAEGRTRLFGRGGSDLSALYLASKLSNARCRLLKDVDGVWERDPRTNAGSSDGPRPNLRHAQLSFVDALSIGGRIVQPKALRFALERALPFEVAALGSNASSGGTRIGGGPSRFAWPAAEPRALRVALLGLGTVGLGVYRELARDPSRFEVRSILVRTKHGRSAARVPHALLTSEASPSVLDGCDVAIELLGGEEPARSLVAAALARGIDVVSANKALVCEHGPELARIAAASGARLRYSAAVGGALPVLESIRALRTGGPIRAFEGVVNSTTNFVLDRLADGCSLEAAVALAHRRGFCEADPWVDLSGEDAAHKLVLAVRTAFGDDTHIDWIEKRGIEALAPEDVRAARAAGCAVRLVASFVRVGSGIEEARVEARLAPRVVDAGNPLASVRAEENYTRIEAEDGRSIVLRGKGAGRWPTTESVLGDLLELANTEPGNILPDPPGVASYLMTQGESGRMLPGSVFEGGPRAT